MLKFLLIWLKGFYDLIVFLEFIFPTLGKKILTSCSTAGQPKYLNPTPRQSEANSGTEKVTKSVLVGINHVNENIVILFFEHYTILTIKLVISNPGACSKTVAVSLEQKFN